MPFWVTGKAWIKCDDCGKIIKPREQYLYNEETGHKQCSRCYDTEYQEYLEELDKATCPTPEELLDTEPF
ncbi:MAG: hypothetical protein AB1330_00960 [Bacillota bacterium]